MCICHRVNGNVHLFRVKKLKLLKIAEFENVYVIRFSSSLDITFRCESCHGRKRSRELMVSDQVLA